MKHNYPIPLECYLNLNTNKTYKKFDLTTMAKDYKKVEKNNKKVLTKPATSDIIKSEKGKERKQK